MKQYFKGVILFSIFTAPLPQCDPSFSSINYPYQDCLVNTQTPSITGMLLDSGKNPVNGAIASIYCDKKLLGTSISDESGVFLFHVSIKQALEEGNHTVYVEACNTTLEPVNFIVDTITPEPPIINNPQPKATLIGPQVIIEGITEPEALVFIFLDESDYADNAYANEEGNWSIQYELEVGSHSVSAQVQSMAGNTSAMSEVTVFEVTK